MPAVHIRCVQVECACQMEVDGLAHFSDDRMFSFMTSLVRSFSGASHEHLYWLH